MKRSKRSGGKEDRLEENEKGGSRGGMQNERKIAYRDGCARRRVQKERQD